MYKLVWGTEAYQGGFAVRGKVAEVDRRIDDGGVIEIVLPAFDEEDLKFRACFSKTTSCHACCCSTTCEDARVTRVLAIVSTRMFQERGLSHETKKK